MLYEYLTNSALNTTNLNVSVIVYVYVAVGVYFRSEFELTAPQLSEDESEADESEAEFWKQLNHGAKRGDTSRYSLGSNCLKVASLHCGLALAFRSESFNKINWKGCVAEW